MFNSAVVCTDGTPDSDLLLAVAPRLRQLGVTQVALACAHDGSTTSSHDLNSALLTQQTTLASRGFETSIELREGCAGRTVASVIDERSADLVVVGVRGIGRNSRIVAECADETSGHVIASPMLSIRLGSSGASPLNHIPLLTKILLAVDFTDASEGAIAAAERLACSGASEIVVLHASADKYPTTESKLALARVAARLRAAGRAKVTEEIMPGSAAEVVTYRAHAGDVTMTVIGSRGHGMFNGLVVGSVGAEVARHIECPLLVVPNTTRESESARLTA